MREEYAASYEKAAAPEEISVEASPAQVRGMLFRPILTTNSFALIQGGVSLFANFSVGPSAVPTVSEVDDYLSRPVEYISDPLKWWIDNRRVYPNLSSMALDYLSIPRKQISLKRYSILTSAVATSTAVERVFSQGRHILHFTRNRLSPSAIRAYLCLGSWARHGLVTTNDFVKAIQSESKKSKRKRDDDAEDKAVKAAA